MVLEGGIDFKVLRYKVHYEEIRGQGQNGVRDLPKRKREISYVM